MQVILYIQDAAASSAYKVLINGNTVAGIDDIDDGAKLYSVASATSVITNNAGTFTFYTTSGTGVSGVTGTGTQIFQIIGDTNGVTFQIDSATGFVTGISGIENSSTVTINITDLTVADSDHYWSKKGTDFANSTNTWLSNHNGVWANDQYMGYIVAGSGSTLAQTVYGIESDTGLNHVVRNNYAKVGTSGTTFALASGVFASATQISFINQSGAAFGASDTQNGLLFSDLASNSSMGILYSSGTQALEIAPITINGSGSVTAISSISSISDTVSLKLGNIALNAGSEYGVSGTGVSFSVNSSIATVDATNREAYVGLGGENGIIFGGTGTGVYNIYSGTSFTTLKDKLQIANGSAGTASGTLTNNIFALGLTNGASVTDTYVGNGDSSLSINGTTFGLYADSTTFSFGTASSGSDTLSVTLGTVGIASDANLATFLGNTNLGLGDSKTSLMLGAFSYTGVEAATFNVNPSVSGTQLATVSGDGVIEEGVASGTSFVFNNSLFTAISDKVAFQINSNATSNTLLAGSSATGTLNTTGNYNIAVLSDTFTMNSGSSVIMTYKAGEQYNANFDYFSGTGTLTAGSGTGTFALSDYWINGGSSAVYVYTASAASDVTLSLNLVGADSGTIAMTAGMGLRSVESGTSESPVTFTFDPDGDGATTLPETLYQQPVQSVRYTTLQAHTEHSAMANLRHSQA